MAMSEIGPFSEMKSIIEPFNGNEMECAVHLVFRPGTKLTGDNYADSKR